MKLLKFISPALPVLIAGLAHAQNIEGVIVEDGQLKLQVLTPLISVEELHNNGAFLPWHRGYFASVDTLVGGTVEIVGRIDDVTALQ